MIADDLLAIATHRANHQVRPANVDAEYVVQDFLAQSIRMSVSAAMTCNTSRSAMQR